MLTASIPAEGEKIVARPAEAEGTGARPAIAEEIGARPSGAEEIDARPDEAVEICVATYEIRYTISLGVLMYSECVFWN